MSEHYKILVADDLEDNLGLLREWLSSQDYYVRCARDGREALEIAREDPPDLILVDKVMPVVDGLSVARELKKEERFATVPIIVLTGRFDTQRSSIFDETGADDLIMKPFTFEEVDTRVRTMLKKREVFRALARANEELRRANQRMSRLVLVDAKTQLHNYRYFMEHLEDEMKRSQRYGVPLTLLMLDIDHFKSVNDRHGHVVGDDVLKEFGQIMRRTARETDSIARYGGEEFTILMTHTTAAQGRRLADRVRRATEAHRFADGQSRRTVAITVSVGVATYPTNDRVRLPQELVKAADDALYAAKRGGRNRTQVDGGSIPPPR
ncbi:MAG: diguanylate cyclase [Acidobacteriota bacterium]